MARNTHPIPRRRLTILALVAVVGALIGAPASASATDPTTPPAVDGVIISAAESAMVSALNADRAAVGLVAVRVDPRLMAIARARSDDMVANNYFGHTQADGRNVFDILIAQHIAWYNAGEIIAWNNYPMDSTVSAANRQWVGSPGHYAIIISATFNYVGVGLAIDPATGKKLWTAVYIKGPDRTGAVARASAPTMAVGPTSATRRARLAWSGSDPRLQVLTSGLSSWTVQRQIDGGTWGTVWSATTLKGATFTLALGHLYIFRISARDHAGNRGAWVTKVVDLR